MEQRIENLSDYVKIIENNSFSYFTSKFLYRGEPKSNYKLLPSVYREGKVYGANNKLYLTRENQLTIIREFIAESAAYIKNINTDSLFEYMEYAQHYGVPTRLLDWTSNPLVALFFACKGNYDVDGKISILNMNAYDKLTYEEFPENFTIKEYVISMLSGNDKEFKYPKVFKPYYIDLRMKSQESWFMVWGSQVADLKSLLSDKGFVKIAKNEKTSNGCILEIVEDVTALSTVIVPKSRKKVLMDQLDSLSVNNSLLFPGLDGIGKDIEYRYNLLNRNTDIDWF